MIVVAIPAHNEEESIGSLVRDCYQFVDKVVVANDRSTDNTTKRARLAGAIVVDVPSDRRGMVGVYTHGLKAALELAHNSTDVVIEMDAGYSHDPFAIPVFVNKLRSSDVDLVTGCRFGMKGALYQGKLRRKALSWFGTRIVNAVHGTRWKDATSGYIAYNSLALDALLAEPYESRGHYYQSEVRLRAKRLGLKILEHPIRYENSGSSLNWGSIKEALRLL